MVLSVPGVVMVFGAAAAIITFFKNKQWVQAALYGCLFLIPILIVGFQQSIPFPRNFSYLAPMVYLLSAYGLVSFGKGIWGEIKQRWMIRIDDPKLRIAVVAVTFVIAGFLLLDSFTGLSLSLAPYHANKLQMADISPFLKNHEYISMLAAVCW